MQGLGVLSRGENIFRRFSSSAASMPTLKSTCHQVQIKSEESRRKRIQVAKKGQSTTAFPHSPPRKTLPQYIKFAQRGCEWAVRPAAVSQWLSVIARFCARPCRPGRRLLWLEVRGVLVSPGRAEKYHLASQVASRGNK